MSDLQTRFDTAAAEAQRLPKRPNNDTLLKLYALFKQATVGDISGKKPGMFDMTGQAKFSAWEKLKGTPKEKAMQDYIDLVEHLKK